MATKKQKGEKKQEVERWVRDPNNAPERVLRRVQRELGPERELEFVAINLYNGEFVVATDPNAAVREFHKRWPDDGYYLCRVDGGPAFRL